VAKVIRNGMYEILEPYHQSFKSETPTPSKTDVRKTLMRELSLRSQDIVSEAEDNIEMFRADRSARKRFKVKKKFKRL
jgi:phosphatidylinositol kinase/protein kinase (PI-3  family)